MSQLTLSIHVRVEGYFVELRASLLIDSDGIRVLAFGIYMQNPETNKQQR